MIDVQEKLRRFVFSTKHFGKILRYIKCLQFRDHLGSISIICMNKEFNE